MKICELQCKIYSSILLQKYIFDMKKKMSRKKTLQTYSTE